MGSHGQQMVTSRMYAVREIPNYGNYDNLSNGRSRPRHRLGLGLGSQPMMVYTIIVSAFSLRGGDRHSHGARPRHPHGARLRLPPPGSTSATTPRHGARLRPLARASATPPPRPRPRHGARPRPPSRPKGLGLSDPPPPRGLAKATRKGHCHPTGLGHPTSRGSAAPPHPTPWASASATPLPRPRATPMPHGAQSRPPPRGSASELC